MSSMFRSLVVGGLMAAMALVAMVTPASAESPEQRAAALRKAGRAAIFGPEVKGLKIAGHEFNVKKAKSVLNHEGVTVTGQISHCLTLRPDDQVYYTIKKQDGIVWQVQIRIEEGGLSKYVAKVAGDDVGRLLSKLGKKIDGKWESAAELLVAHIAKVAQESDNPSKRAPAPYKPKSSK